MTMTTVGTAQVQSSTSNKVYDIFSDELDWEVVSSHERDMGPEKLWSAHIEHDELGTLRWEVTEYPEGFLGEIVRDLNGHEIVQDFSVSLDYETDKNYEAFVRHASNIMEQWFRENYEDPANSLPYDTREGGYQWIYGGPTTPIEALEEEFGGKYPSDVIEEVASRIEDELIDWTPIPGPDFFSDGEKHLPEQNVSPEDLLERFRTNRNFAASMSEQDLVDSLVQWFHHFYEDPQNETPFDSEEGDFVYIYGGPYNAEEVIRDSFGSFVTDAVIQEVVDQVQRDGTVNWAPSPNHSDQINAADEHRKKQEEETRSGFGLHLRRETGKLVLNSDRFSLALARLFRIAQGEFSLALLGRWGSGKTSIADLVAGYLQDSEKYQKEIQKVFGEGAKDEAENRDYEIVKFNAWRYRQKPELWVWLYESFLIAFLKCNPLNRVLRSVRFGLQKHGLYQSLFTLVTLAFLAVPSMWISQVLPYGLAVFGISGLLGLVFLARRWYTSLRRLYDKYGMVTTHREHLGMQALIGEDLKALVTSWTNVHQFAFRDKVVFGFLLFLVAVVWFSTFFGGESGWLIDVLKTAASEKLDTDAAQVLNASKVAWGIWCLIAITFFGAVISNIGRADRILLIVDDLDRCPPDEIVDLIDGIKLMIDDEDVGKLVQAFVLADDTVLEAAIRRRFEGLSSKEDGNPGRWRAAVREHMEKVFLCHVSLPVLSAKGIEELVTTFSKEFGLETKEAPLKKPSQSLDAPEKVERPTAAPSLPSSPAEPAVEFVLSIDEHNAIRSALSSQCEESDEIITPRTVRSFLVKYQFARMLLQSNRITFESDHLVEKLALEVSSARISGKVSEKQIEDGDAVSLVVRLVA
ncbi:hypothetical protein J7399_09415 [Shimia sp. R9_1]|uniref:P-loop NTPase fold protein n=1 Tax=Shimia sp. R9_1 TaxID=2821111 RepID=UPI001ADA1E02|nr:P-loop NTPase fold protein [Shimia sp. R9_1]MBO9407646.1 hypothetical protein [Shimia sp. R9_1]